MEKCNIETALEQHINNVVTYAAPENSEKLQRANNSHTRNDGPSIVMVCAGEEEERREESGSRHRRSLISPHRRREEPSISHFYWISRFALDDMVA